MTILKNIAEACNRFHDISGCKGGIAFLCARDMRIAVLVDPEGRAGRGVDLRPAHDECTAGSAVAHIVAAGIDRANNIYIAARLHTLCLFGRFRHGPVSAGRDGFNIVVAIADCDGRGRAAADLDLHDVTDHLLGQTAVVEQPFILRHVRRNVVFRL